VFAVEAFRCVELVCDATHGYGTESNNSGELQGM
jgi:hypothetical protein